MPSPAPRLILASGSPQRRTLLASLGLPFDVATAPLREPDFPSRPMDGRHWAEAMAYFKARAVAERFSDGLILGADTVVVCAGRLLGKPRDLDDARDMLERQARVTCEVVTGVCVLRAGGGSDRVITCDVTRVEMHDDPDLREAYLATGDWDGKAGAYGIQSRGDQLVRRIEGSFSNVVGLPLERLVRILRGVGIAPPLNPL